MACLVLCALPAAAQAGDKARALVIHRKTAAMDPAQLDAVRQNLDRAGLEVVVLPALTMSAEPAPVYQRGNGILSRASSRYEAFDYAGTLSALSDLESLLLAHSGRPKVRQLLSRGYVLAARTHFDNGDVRAARRAFQRAYRLAPTMKALNASQFRPAVVKAYADAAAAVDATSPKKLAVRTRPPDALLSIDGIGASASTEVQLPVPVVVQRPDYARRALWVEDTRPKDIALNALPESEVLSSYRQALAASTLATAILAELAHRTSCQWVVVVDGDVARVWKRGEVGLASPVAFHELGTTPAIESGSTRGTEAVVSTTADEARPWYRRPWVRASAVAGAAAVVGTVLYFSLADRGSESRIDGWCLEVCP